MKNTDLDIYIWGVPKFKPKADKNGLPNYGKDLSYWLESEHQLDLFANRLYLITAAHVIIR